MEEELRKAILARASGTAQNAQNAFGRTSLTSPAASRLPTSDFSSIQPRQQPTLPFAGGGTASFGLGGANVNYPSYPSRLGLMGGNIASGAISPLPVQTQQSLAAGLTPLAQSSMGIDGGPISLTGATAMTSPKTAEQQGRVATAVGSGTIYATPQQMANLNSGLGGFAGGGQRSPAEQQALLAQVRQRGSQMAGAQEQFFAQKASERTALRSAEAAARGAGASSMDIMRAREATQPSTIGQIRKQALAYQQRLPMEGLASNVASRFARSISGYSPSPFQGGQSGSPQPANVSALGLSGYDLYNQQQAQKFASGKYNAPQGFGAGSSLGTYYPSSSNRNKFVDNRIVSADLTGQIGGMV